jgi:hypothetical protein
MRAFLQCGYPASHGCIRLPYDFSQLLFATTVVLTDYAVVRNPNRNAAIFQN